MTWELQSLSVVQMEIWFAVMTSILLLILATIVKLSWLNTKMCIFKILIGSALIIGGVLVEITWLGICFGTVILGIVLLFFAPDILLAPFTIGVGLGMAFLASCNE